MNGRIMNTGSLEEIMRRLNGLAGLLQAHEGGPFPGPVPLDGGWHLRWHGGKGDGAVRHSWAWSSVAGNVLFLGNSRDLSNTPAVFLETAGVLLFTNPAQWVSRLFCQRFPHIPSQSQVHTLPTFRHFSVLKTILHFLDIVCC